MSTMQHITSERENEMNEKTVTDIIADAIRRAKALGLQAEYDQALTVLVDLDEAGLKIVKRPTHHKKNG